MQNDLKQPTNQPKNRQTLPTNPIGHRPLGRLPRRLTPHFSTRTRTNERNATSLTQGNPGLTCTLLQPVAGRHQAVSREPSAVGWLPVPLYTPPVPAHLHPFSDDAVTKDDLYPGQDVRTWKPFNTLVGAQERQVIRAERALSLGAGIPHPLRISTLHPPGTSTTMEIKTLWYYISRE